jgi:hypothetical protein
MPRQSRFLMAPSLILFSALISLGTVAPGMTSHAVAETPAPSTTSQVAPIDLGKAQVMDLPVSSADQLQIVLTNARFDRESVGQLNLSLRGLNLRDGMLQGMTAKVSDGRFDNIPVKLLELTSGAFSFDTMTFLNQRKFVLDRPVQGNVTLQVTEADLNTFLKAPETVERLEKAISKRTGNIRLVRLTQPELVFLGKNNLQMKMTLSVGEAIASPMVADGSLTLRNGSPVFSLKQISSGNVPLPVDVATLVEKEMNKLLDFQKLGKGSVTINANTLDVTKKLITLKGTATVNKLSFGKS